MEWDLKEKYYEDHRISWDHHNDIQLTFRTRQPNGLLFKIDNIEMSKYIIVEV